MYLIKLNMPLRDAETRRAIRDSQRMHQITCDLFDCSRQDASILYRTRLVGDTLQVYIYADRPAQFNLDKYSITQKDISHWVDGFCEGQVLTYDLLASPSQKVHKEGRKNSQRRILRSVEERAQWLSRKSEAFGFELLSVDEVGSTHLTGQHRTEKGDSMHVDGYQYRGYLRVTDPVLFKDAIQKGIGPGKAYGLGMLMVSGT